METRLVAIEKPPELNLVLGQSHFIKTVEDIYEALVTAVPGIKFGLAFCEASGDRLVRSDGTDEQLVALAAKNALAIGAGHSFIIFLRECYPLNVLDRIKQIPEVCHVFAATSNPLQVVIAESSQGRGILGVIDGEKPTGLENGEQKKERREFLRKIGYKK